MKFKSLIILGCFAPLAVYAQTPRIFQNVNYSVEGNVSGATGADAPLWFSANRYGLSSTENTSGYLRGAIERRIETDSLHKWKFGYGLDVAVPYNFTSHVVVQQLYAEAQFMKVRLSFGSKEQSQLFKNNSLSLGGMTFSNNARPVPQLRAELADWWNITGRAHFLSIRGHIAYGMLTDGDWQERFVGGEESRHVFAKNILYHSKAGYFRLGDERRFPLTGMFGLEMVSTFGGEVWNLGDRGGTGNEDFQAHQKFGHSFRDFFNAFIPGGSDVNDGAYSNAAGNQLGSWVFSIDWNTPEWGVRAYMDHFFEDHSMMFFQYGWRDNLIGLEGRLPHNPVVSHVVYEFLNTTDQSGSVYHDATSVLPEQISGSDNYYNHHVYGAYQHWGQVLGNPLIVSPIYNASHTIQTFHNRIRAHHIGLSGNPSPVLSWRALYTHQRSLGAYNIFVEDNVANHFLGEVRYSPTKTHGWTFGLAVASTTGSPFSSTYGLQATVTKTGIIRRK